MTTATTPTLDKRAILDELDRLRDAFGGLKGGEFRLDLTERSDGAAFAERKCGFTPVSRQQMSDAVDAGGCLVAVLVQAGIIPEPVPATISRFESPVYWYSYLSQQFPQCDESTGIGVRDDAGTEYRTRWIHRAEDWSAMAVERLRRAVEGIEAEPQMDTEDAKRQGDETPVPVKRLIGWPAIFSAIEMDRSRETERSIARYNKMTDGPITLSRGRGSKPWTERDALIAWWNGLEKRLAEINQRGVDRAAATADTYSHGKNGIVAPTINGEVKGRRTKTSQNRKR